MPTPGRAWWHLILSTKCAWLHGDPRRFRSRDHRVHSSGDYHRRPPADEHEGLRRWHREHDGAPIVFAAGLRPRIGEALRTKCQKAGAQCLAISVGGMHAHLLVGWDDDYSNAKAFAGRLKQAASHAVRVELPGRVWAEGGRPIRVNGRPHQRNVFGYICDHAKEGAWVWRFDRG